MELLKFANVRQPQVLFISMNISFRRDFIEGSLTEDWAANGAVTVVAKTISHQDAKKTVTSRDLPYTARTRMKKSTLLVFIASIRRAALMYHNT